MTVSQCDQRQLKIHEEELEAAEAKLAASQMLAQVNAETSLFNRNRAEALQRRVAFLEEAIVAKDRLIDEYAACEACRHDQAAKVEALEKALRLIVDGVDAELGRRAVDVNWPEARAALAISTKP